MGRLNRAICGEAERVELLGRQPVADDERDDDLAPLGIGLADHRDLAHARMAQQHFLDLARIDVRAAADDEVLGAVLQREEAVAVECSQVAGPEPPRAQGLRRGLRGAPVAGHHGVAANEHLADLAGGQRPAFAIADPHLDQHLRNADRGDALCQRG